MRELLLKRSNLYRREQSGQAHHRVYWRPATSAFAALEAHCLLVATIQPLRGSVLQPQHRLPLMNWARCRT